MDSEIPDLEDFSDIIKPSKSTNKIINHENQIVVKSNIEKNEIETKSDFGGMKKGFLSNNLAMKKFIKDDNIPYLKANPQKSKNNLIFKEVQEKHKKNQWMTDDLINQVSNDSKLSTWLSNPKTAQILSEFESNPRAAILKYKDDKETQEMLSQFGNLLGGHFKDLGKNNDATAVNDGEIIIPGLERTSDASAKSAVDNQVDKALATNGVREALLDPAIQMIVNCLRTDQDKAYRLIKEANKETHDKLKLLVESGVLGIQQ